MNVAHVLSIYLNLNLMIGIGFVGLKFFSIFLKKIHYNHTARSELRLHYTVMLMIILLTAVYAFIPGRELFRIPEESGSMMRNIFGVLLLSFGAGFLLRDIRTLRKLKKKSFLVRAVGRVRILVSDAIQVPFSYWTLRYANVMVPHYLVERPEDYRIAITHELQHHRHGDTRWVYGMWVLRFVCILNPFIHFWNRWISEIQEFACDETLLQQSKVDSQAYARCLVEVAQSAIDQKYVPVCATGLTFLVERNLLRRRIEKMLKKTGKTAGHWVLACFGIFLVSAMAASASASKSLVSEREVSLSEARDMAEKAESNSGFKVFINDSVFTQLNRYVGTADGREFMRNALKRMKNHESAIEDSIEQYKVPEELIAMPITASGYQNMTQLESDTPSESAGIWQVTSQTAKKYGLTVTDKRDDRVNVAKSTDAVLRYLQSLQLRFKDWHLTLLAYNLGEKEVERRIAATGSRDAWTVSANGAGGDKEYLSKLIAAVIIMNNPDSVK